MKTKLIAIFGKSGVGKDTILSQLLEDYGGMPLNKLTLYTTRPKRESEIDGDHYIFIDDKQFDELAQAGEIEVTNEYNGWKYGISESSIKHDKVNIGVFTPMGIHKIIQSGKMQILTFHIRTDDKTRLMRQLMREINPDVKEIIRRYGTDEKDFEIIDFPHMELFNNNKEDKDRLIKVLHDIIDIQFEGLERLNENK